MALDFAVQYPCPVRAALAEDDLLRLRHDRVRTRAIVAALRRDPAIDKRRPEADWTFNARVRTAVGVGERVVRVGDLLEEVAPLERLATHCRGCAANLARTEFGCSGTIAYPITEAAERFLLGRLPADLGSPRGRLLLKAIADFGFDGAEIDAQRNERAFVNLASPVHRIWESEIGTAVRLSSSQLLHMTIGVGSYAPAHAKLVAYVLSYLDDQFKPVVSSGREPLPGDDPCTALFKLFLMATSFAGANTLPMLVDA